MTINKTAFLCVLVFADDCTSCIQNCKDEYDVKEGRGAECYTVQDVVHCGYENCTTACTDDQLLAACTQAEKDSAPECAYSCEADGGMSKDCQDCITARMWTIDSCGKIQESIWKAMKDCDAKCGVDGDDKKMVDRVCDRIVFNNTAKCSGDEKLTCTAEQTTTNKIPLTTQKPSSDSTAKPTATVSLTETTTSQSNSVRLSVFCILPLAFRYVRL